MPDANGNPTHEELVRWSQLSYSERLGVLTMVHGEGNIPREALDAIALDEVKRQYGYLAAYLDHPEVGPILRQAGSGGWTQERLQAELHKTAWWQNTSASQREWDLLWRTDPQEAKRRQEGRAAELRSISGQLGLSYSESEIWYMAGMSLSLNSSQEEMRQGLFAQLQYQPGQAARGTTGVTMAQVKARASDYGLPMSDQAAFDWAKRVGAGLETNEGVEAYLREQAKGRYSWLAADIDRGATVRQIMDPIIQQTAQLLEVDPHTIDLTDSRFSAMIDHVDASNTRRAMTLAEAATYARSREEWQNTENARQAAANAAESLLRTFGKVAG